MICGQSESVSIQRMTNLPNLQETQIKPFIIRDLDGTPAIKEHISYEPYLFQSWNEAALQKITRDRNTYIYLYTTHTYTHTLYIF